MELTLADIILHLARTRNDEYSQSPNRFYALILNCFQRIETDSIRTMDVAVRSNKLVLRYNPVFLRKLSFPMACMAVKHEALHILLDHIPRHLTLIATAANDDVRRRRQHHSNIAMDLAVNSLLRADPDWSKVVNEFPWVLPEKNGFPDKLSYEVYLELLLKREEGANEPIQGEAFDEHGFSDLTSDEQNGGDIASFDQLQSIANQVREQTKHVVREALKNRTPGAGIHLPLGVATWLEQYLVEPKVPWWTLLTTRIHGSRMVKPVRSIQRPNRILQCLAEEDPRIIPAIGTAYDPSYRIFNVIDVSGSMSDQMVAIGLRETQALMRTDEEIEVRVLEGTDEIISDRLYRGSDELPMLRSGSGGTDFNAYFQYLWDRYIHQPNLEPDLVVVYTDGDSWQDLRPELFLPPHIPLIWLMSPEAHAGHHLKQLGYGDVIWADPEQSTHYED